MLTHPTLDLLHDLGLHGMALAQGDVQAWPHEPMDVMIALHACDTATDHAIHLGIRGGAAIILCAPCCHKQLRPQLIPMPESQVRQDNASLLHGPRWCRSGCRRRLLAVTPPV